MAKLATKGARNLSRLPYVQNEPKLETPRTEDIAAMTPPLFTDKEVNTWAGGSYEMAIVLGPRSDARLESALLTLWRNARLEGCYLRSDIEPSDQQRVKPSLRLLEQHRALLGIATVPGCYKVACGACAVRQDSGIDWLAFYIPMGALSAAYDVGAFPFDDGKDSQAWRDPLDDCLVEMAQAVFAVTPFSLALIGHEVAVTVYAADIAAKGIPPERWDGYLWAENGTLIWYPPTIYSALFIMGS